MISFLSSRNILFISSIFIFLNTGVVFAKESTSPYRCDQWVSLDLEKQLNQQMQSMTREQAKLFVEQHAEQLAQSAFCRYQLTQQKLLIEKNKQDAAIQSSTGFSVQQTTIAKGSGL